MRVLSPRISEFSGYLPTGAQNGTAFGALLQGNIAGFATRVLDTLFAWQRRWTDRAALQSLDDRMLRDIGLSRAEVEFESSKPFWRS